ncbi:BTAD domain-containing putative transcriptional regulator [Amycolatopsis sp. WQ 127309]|uniref:AfsR/SARP family transcriptional regulator n=1 Tax=Amycolatopsis sp. WQ 127309 TaxID=2932773 RepID=UPI001FF4CD26|nr:BTAD domain-containing putative transcriptional regulator [Amycolatopsis sp. WQ 127309]UOZ05050.1 tetratricopeptide repeat protein [Amycolatopsis sp. WQ 127309]
MGAVVVMGYDMGAEVRFHLLGPLTVTVGGRALPLGGAKQRALLAHLLLNANRLVPPGQLIDTIWPSDPPTSATANLQTYVWRLRRLLPETTLRTHGPGYSLAVEPGDVDAHDFARLVADAARAAKDGAPETALTLLAEAEALWRGDPLSDLPTAPAWDAELGRLTENRFAAVEERLSLQVLLGRYDPAIAELTVLLAEHPYRERLWQQYLLALTGVGRRADALRAYTTARERLVTELGVEPGPELRALQAAILAGRPVVAAGADGSAPLRQLPADLPDFTGRDDYVRDLEAALGAGPAPVVLTGAPGTGKTALAMHVAHRLADRFPDGQLYVDLAGTGAPRDPAEVLADFLHALGVTGTAVPAGLGQRAALFRSRLAGRRVLLVLDDTATAAQVRPLLPGDAGCAVLVTTRGRLPELAGAKHVELSVFGEREAQRLLAGVAGVDRIDGEPAEAAAIVACCGYLPLAIRIAGARLAGRQAWSLRTLHDRLAGEAGRLSELRVGDLGVRSSFELSLRQLGPAARTAFCRTAVLGAQDFPSWVFDALLDRRGTHEVLDVLVDANLVSLVGLDASGQPRYRLHDLLRCYAAELLDAEPAAVRRDALARVLCGLLALAKTAAAALPPAFGAMTGRSLGPLPPDAARLVADPLAWFTAERKLLAAAVQLAADAGLDELAWQLTATAVPFYDLRGAYDDWRRSHLTAQAAARAAGNRAGEAVLARGLGQIGVYNDEYPAAVRNLERSAALFAELGDVRGEALAVAGLGTVARIRDRPRDALDCYGRALAGLERAGDRSGVAQLRNSIGAAHARLAEFTEAADWLGRARDLAREMGDAHREARVLTEFGTLHRDTGRLPESLACLRLALGIFEDLDDERCVAYALLGIAQTLLAVGEPVQARGVCDRALRVFRESGNRQGETTGLALLDQARHRRSPVVSGNAG